MTQAFPVEAVRSIKRAFHAGGEVLCPRCGVAMDRREIPPRPDVSYVRDRAWLNCPSCHGSLVVDRREGR